MHKLTQRYRYATILLRQLVITEFKLRYQGSALGYVWTLMRPLFLFLTLYIVFGKFFRFGDAIPDFPVYLLVGIVLWSYFSEVTNTGLPSILSRGDLLRKINFPRYVIVLAGSFSALINLCLNSIIILVFMIISGVEITSGIIWLPLLIIELFVLSLGLAFFLSALFVRFRDINYIWEVLLQAAFYATPILYPLSFVLDQSLLAAKILMLNPMAQIIQDVREIAVTTKTETIGEVYGNGYVRLIPVLLVIVIAVIAAYYFRSRSKYFAEEV